jgi:hypothetical protein
MDKLDYKAPEIDWGGGMIYTPFGPDVSYLDSPKGPDLRPIKFFKWAMIIMFILALIYIFH